MAKHLGLGVSVLNKAPPGRPVGSGDSGRDLNEWSEEVERANIWRKGSGAEG